MYNNTVLITGIMNGDEQILKKFYKDTVRYVRGYILRNYGNKQDVEDVFQDAIIVLYQQLQSNILEITSSLKTYFYGICKNIWRNKLRRKTKVFFTDTLEYFEAKTTSSILATIESEEKEFLYKKYLKKLPSDKKHVLQLYFEGNSMLEIAQIMGYSEKYARKKKFLAKKELLDRMQQDPTFREYQLI